MRCEKCGYVNSEYDIICEKCGSPLKIEDNIELQKKYNHKQRAIDIDEIDIPENQEAIFDDTKKKISNILVVLLLIGSALLLAILFGIIKDFRSRDIINQYNKFMTESDLGVLYLGSDSELNNFITDYSSVYNFPYLFVDTENITAFKRNRIKKELKLSKIKSTVVIISKGKKIAEMDDCSLTEKEELISFLQKNKVLPNDIGDPNEVIKKFETAITSKEPTIIYYVHKKTDNYDKKNKKISSFCENYSIDYKYIEGYYLTDNQNLSLLKKLNYNELQEELLIVVDEEKIVQVIEDVNPDSENYFKIMSSYGIIDESSSKSLKNINFNELKNIILMPTKNVIVFGRDDCPYCERLNPIIGKVGIQNNITIYYYKLDNSNTVDDYLLSIGYKGGKLTPPVIIVTENNHVLDYMIGLTDKELINQKFKELGVIS